jgi:serine/threonine protein phosphatase 1
MPAHCVAGTTKGMCDLPFRNYSWKSKMSDTKTALGTWAPLSACGPKAQVFTIGDVHGQADLLDAALAEIRRIPRSADLRRLVFLGDIIDRGPASLRAVALVSQAADLAGVDDVVLLPGNHELMLLDGLDAPQMYITDWLDNGGDSVIREADPDCTARKLVDLAKIARVAIGDAFLDWVRTGPTWHIEGDLLFVHAGVDPHQDVATFLAKPRLLAMDDDHWAWIREPFLDWNKGWNGRVIVHGHTPAVRRQSDLNAFAGAADRIRTQSRLCLDAGAAFLPQLGWAEFRTGDYRLCLTSLF